MFGRQDEQPVIETSQRYPIPTGFMDNEDVVLAFLLKKGDKNYGASLYKFEPVGVSLEKKLIGSMDENQWRSFKNKLEEAKAKGYVEDDEKVSIPSVLCEGKRGFYAIGVKRQVKEKDDKTNKNAGIRFVRDGVNIYQTDENMRNVFVRSMNEKTWHNFSILMARMQREEEEIRQASLSKFAILSEK